MAIESEIDALKAVDEALMAIDKEAQTRVLEWANSKFLGIPVTKKQIEIPVEQNQGRSGSPVKPRVKRSKSKSKTTKGSKVIIKQIKDLNLRPKGKQSARDFVAEKTPTNQKQKGVVALYYLLSILELDKASVDHICTVFKDVRWPAPTDLLNTLQQAGSEGWLDTSDSTDIKITPIGENVVEHDLPKSKKS